MLDCFCVACAARSKSYFFALSEVSSFIFFLSHLSTVLLLEKNGHCLQYHTQILLFFAIIPALSIFEYWLVLLREAHRTEVSIVTNDKAVFSIF